MKPYKIQMNIIQTKANRIQILIQMKIPMLTPMRASKRNNKKKKGNFS